MVCTLYHPKKKRLNSELITHPGGASLGLALAAGPSRFIAQIVGDGTYLFSVPSSVHWIARRYRLPVLTIVLNNSGWQAPRRSLLLVHPDGAGSKATNEEMNISFEPSPLYAEIAKASAGGELWAGAARTREELERMLKEAVESVKNGVGAVLDARLDAPPEGAMGGGKAALIG